MLEAHDLSARRGFTRLFSGLSFAVGAGEALVVTGANGTGKTTLLRIVAGLSSPAGGHVRWRGRPVAGPDPELRRLVTYVGHLPALKDELTAEENLAGLVGLSGGAVSRTRLREALDRAELGRQRRLPARVLSQGQRRRVALARVALSERTLWLLDEPLTALDAAGASLLGELSREHLERGGLMVVATHAALEIEPARMHALRLS